MHRWLLILAALALTGLTAATASTATVDRQAAHNARFQTCMLAGAGCSHRVEEGDIWRVQPK